MGNDTQTVTVPHLGYSIVGYKFGRSYNPDLPTLVMANSFSTSVELYRPQFVGEELNKTVNLLAVEPLVGITEVSPYSITEIPHP